MEPDKSKPEKTEQPTEEERRERSKKAKEETLAITDTAFFERQKNEGAVGAKRALNNIKKLLERNSYGKAMLLQIIKPECKEVFKRYTEQHGETPDDTYDKASQRRAEREERKENDADAGHEKLLGAPGEVRELTLEQLFAGPGQPSDAALSEAAEKEWPKLHKAIVTFVKNFEGNEDEPLVLNILNNGHVLIAGTCSHLPPALKDTCLMYQAGSGNPHNFWASFERLSPTEWKEGGIWMKRVLPTSMKQQVRPHIEKLFRDAGAKCTTWRN